MLTRVSSYPTSRTGLDESGEMGTSVKCPKSYKEYFTVIKNVKKAHEINDFGENQEFNDDVDYILDGLSRYWKLCHYDECGYSDVNVFNFSVVILSRPAVWLL